MMGGTVCPDQQRELRVTQKRSRTAVMIPVFLKSSDNGVAAGSKRSVPRTIQGHGNKVPNFNMGRIPAAARCNATIDPVEATVGST